MDIGSASRLGPYDLVSPRAAGGARGTRPDRSVAMKVRPAEFALVQNWTVGLQP